MSSETILVVDDDKQIVRLLRQYLVEAGYTVRTAFDGGSALRAVRSAAPDMMILDLGLPDQDGWDVTRTIRGDAQLGTLPIIMLTARVGDAEKIVGLELGADDYIPKPFNAREVVARVRAVLRRKQWEQRKQPLEALHSGDLELDLERRICSLDGRPIDLTPTEFKLLQILMQSPGATFHREELLEKALGYGYEGQGRTLDTHIKNLRHKIEPDPSHPTYIQTVYRVGYRFTT